MTQKELKQQLSALTKDWDQQAWKVLAEIMEEKNLQPPKMTAPDILTYQGEKYRKVTPDRLELEMQVTLKDILMEQKYRTKYLKKIAEHLGKIAAKK